MQYTKGKTGTQKTEVGTQAEDECHVYECVTGKQAQENEPNAYENVRETRGVALEQGCQTGGPEQKNALYEPLRKVGAEGKKSSVGGVTGCAAWLRKHRVGLALSLVVIGMNVALFIGYVVYKTGDFTD